MPAGIGYGKTVPSEAQVKKYNSQNGGKFASMIAKRANKKGTKKTY